MSKFKNFLLERIYKLTDTERAQIDHIVNVYTHIFKGVTDLKTERSDLLNDNDEVHIGEIEYVDLEDGKTKKINVVVVSSEKEYRASFDINTNTITLNFNILGTSSVNLLQSSLMHELLHAKQQYKKKGEEYSYATRKRTKTNGEETVRSKRGYFLHPTEFPVHTTVAIEEIRKQYKELNDRITAARNANRLGELKFWTDKLDTFKLFLKTFLKSGGNMPEEIAKPIFNKNQSEFISTLLRNKSNPRYTKYYQKFFNAVFQIYTQLTKA